MDAGKSADEQQSEPKLTTPPQAGVTELKQEAEAASDQPPVELASRVSDGRWLSDVDLEYRLNDQKAAVSRSILELPSSPSYTTPIPITGAGTANLPLAELSTPHCRRTRAGGPPYCLLTRPLGWLWATWAPLPSTLSAPFSAVCISNEAYTFSRLADRYNWCKANSLAGKLVRASWLLLLVACWLCSAEANNLCCRTPNRGPGSGSS